ncbi:E3 ubiquitin/ISG15 ligase TRIM25-like [Bufo bufo]|uniref:E3 ubiquitin/ISG15 ligase TRIM25-like n=1 Tax=Bufo bufo TaxID=8384 RepID=UPI001ABDA98E|nr:E3 ubiquitin/ISG15 ligase TRIM25-like [Bufo bufo]XP_040291250.1 E3 ubiquitin/ISG15 ligase TRIM25-like [Bufo bufo]XP_040291251.1 E3 ubiquitin/ISG15 ligase TRIM25-like [Bufo bufo]XP_040291252.1 E3 ubiquitin/ISG15 ligase TRIM25-like [Bufo bufo]XP_040291253.1 E3 ubiquitin/ISG15 ligase TRIM25-like [Bufo bufo]XP_040291255.1 E3 ubiquitin/ISG15 ligase TRIM25-like [Bufo bufo]
MAQSLGDMEEELSCSICLSLFSTPVTLPCGHNFCSECLDCSWEDVYSYSCPQCRHPFPSKPELRKNTVLSNLVRQLNAARLEDPDPPEEKDEEDETPDKEAVLCDSCRKVAASKTCLTCLASFCQEHLQPHLHSPAFLDHLLSQPLRDLQQRKCAEHSKLLDHYCWEHGSCLCCYCALTHKTCKTYTLQEAKRQKELHYTNMLRSVNQKIEKATSTAQEVQREQRRVLETSKKKKELLEAEYEEIKSLIDEERHRAMAKIVAEEQKVNKKFIHTQSVLTKKQKEYEGMHSKVQSLLQEQDDFQFLKRASNLMDTTSKDPFKPKTEFDDRLLQSIYNNAVSLKDLVKAKIYQMAETPESKSQPPEKAHGAESRLEGEKASRWRPPTSPAPGKQEEKPKSKFKPNKQAADTSKTKPYGECPKVQTGEIPKEMGKDKFTKTNADPREELLMYTEKLSADPTTVHKKILLSNLFTRLSVSDIPQNYKENPQRFVSCSQLLCSQGFSQGIHYWEIIKEGGNFSGLGVAYQSIARNRAESRLGRNKLSWCIEWCNGKLQAWHDDKQTDLTTPNTNKYGVLLNCDQGFISFYCVGKKFSEIYKFRARFTEPVYPAFWMFSSQTVLVLNAFQSEPSQSK